MAMVKQVRVLRNVVSMLMLYGIVAWLVRDHFWHYGDALALGVLGGLAYGAVRWWRLRRRIARRDRRYEPNKIFVDYLHGLEVILAVITHNVHVFLPLALGLLAVMIVTSVSAPWWTVLVSSFGLMAMIVVAGCVVWYERHSGPLYYQYRSDTWSGAEGLLYRTGVVVQPLTPTGKVKIGGVLWNATSISGETMQVGTCIEVIAVERLTLRVDRLPEEAAPASGVRPPGRG
jgi:membrane protein implicated in regulation of membrane protease activity